MATFYMVGGAVRDQIMGIPSKDIDFTVEAESYEAMRDAIVERGSTIFLEKEEFLTIRAKMPFANKIVDADFVLARKESDSDYSDGRRPNKVVIGTLYDDLSRRDFTMNAIAKGEDGLIFDPFDGRADIAASTIRAVGSADDRFRADRLRVLRAIRFAITKMMTMDDEIVESIHENSSLAGVSAERIMDEVNKMMRADRFRTMDMLFRRFNGVGTHVLEAVGFEATLKPDYLK